MKKDWFLDLNDALLPDASVEGANTKNFGSGKDIKERMEMAYSEGITANENFWSEADIDPAFEAEEAKILSQKKVKPKS